MELSHDDPRPVYLQIAAALREDIAAGRLGHGSRLPSGRELAKEFGTALMTVQHALRVLRDEGLVLPQQGRGVFVRIPTQTHENVLEPPTPEAAVATRLEAIRLELSRMNERLAAIEQRLEGRSGATVA